MQKGHVDRPKTMTLQKKTTTENRFYPLVVAVTTTLTLRDHAAVLISYMKAYMNLASAMDKHHIIKVSRSSPVVLDGSLNFLLKASSARRGKIKVIHSNAHMLLVHRNAIRGAEFAIELTRCEGSLRGIASSQKLSIDEHHWDGLLACRSFEIIENGASVLHHVHLHIFERNALLFQSASDFDAEGTGGTSEDDDPADRADGDLILCQAQVHPQSPHRAGDGDAHPHFPWHNFSLSLSLSLSPPFLFNTG